MDTAQWPQEIVVKPIEEIIVTNNNINKIKSDDQDQKTTDHHQLQEALKCPRCNSGNTKFCYYNNYSLTQPRFFCKACRRYWTQGGSLRNIPVGGASRKINKIRSSSSSKIINNNNNRLPDLVQGQDLNLALTRDINTKVIDGNNNNSNSFGMMINSSFVHPHHPLTTTSSASFGFSLNDNTQEQDFKPSLDFSLDGISGSGVQESGGNNNNNNRLLFPFEDYLKGSNGINVIEPSNNNNNSNIKDQEDFPATGYWTGMLGGGSW